MDFEKNSESIHFQMVGPIIEHENRDSMEKFSAIRPLWSRYENFSKGFKNSEVLWPLGISRLAGKDLHQRFLFAIRDDEDVTSSESAYRNFLFPFFFRGKSSKGVPYMAIFPFWGSLKEFIGFDNVDFRLFPLYLSTEKGDLKGKQILFPIFSKVESPKLSKLKIFPFWGRSQKKDESQQSFFLWPLFHSIKSLKEGKEKSGSFFLPFFGILRSNNPEKGKFSRNLSILWPFFSFTKTESLRSISCPWPIYRKTISLRKSANSSLIHLWPIWGKDSQENRKKTFLFWPFHQKEVALENGQLSERFYVLPFFWRFTKKNKQNESVESYHRFWPFMSINRVGSSKEIRLMDPWPNRRVGPIDRNWSPLWTLYRGSKNADLSKHDFFWGTLKYQKSSSHSNFSLFPLIHRESSVDKNYRKWEILGGIFSRIHKNDSLGYRFLWIFGTESPSR